MRWSFWEIKFFVLLSFVCMTFTLSQMLHLNLLSLCVVILYVLVTKVRFQLLVVVIFSFSVTLCILRFVFIFLFFQLQCVSCEVGTPLFHVLVTKVLYFIFSFLLVFLLHLQGVSYKVCSFSATMCVLRSLYCLWMFLHCASPCVHSSKVFIWHF